MTTPPTDTPAHHIHMARIYLHRARETVHRDWLFTLLTWAGERRRRAAELMRAGPQQKEIFAAEALLARALHAQVAALTAQPAAPQGVAYAELPDVDALAQEIRRVERRVMP